MKKICLIIILTLTIITIYSCQDEFCLDSTTPSLIIKLYDKDDVSSKKSASLIIWANEKDTLFNGISTDSISLPLDTKNNNVIYHFSLIEDENEDEENSNDINNQEDININYTIEDIFVSKSCGFKSVFNDVNISITKNNWINNFTTTVTEITNEDQAHVKIFH